MKLIHNHFNIILCPTDNIKLNKKSYFFNSWFYREYNQWLVRQTNIKNINFDFYWYETNFLMLDNRRLRKNILSDWWEKLERERKWWAFK